MDRSKLVENVENDPNTTSKEAGFAISFVKADEEATISSGIASQIRRLIGHSEFTLKNLQTYNSENDTYNTINDVTHYDGGSIVGVKGTIPIETLKIRSSPRSSRGYAQIISSQEEVSFDD